MNEQMQIDQGEQQRVDIWVQSLVRELRQQSYLVPYTVMARAVQDAGNREVTPDDQMKLDEAIVLRRLVAHLALNAHIKIAKDDRQICHNVGVDTAISEIHKLLRGETTMHPLVEVST